MDSNNVGLDSCFDPFFESPKREPELTSIPKVIAFTRSVEKLESGPDSFQQETATKKNKLLLGDYYHGERVPDKKLPLAKSVTAPCVPSDFRLPGVRDVPAQTGHDALGSYEDKSGRAAGSGRIEPESDDAGKTKSDHGLRAVYQSAFKSAH